MKLEFCYSIEHEDGYAVLDVPKFPEITVSISEEDQRQGRVRSIANDAIKNAIQARIDYNDEIPSSDVSNLPLGFAKLQLTPLAATKALLYIQYRKSGKSKAEFAKSIEVGATTLNRIFDLSHESRFDVVLEAFEKLNLDFDHSVSVKRRKLGS
ncbi:hypothetical protein AAFO92_15985 [Roseovarius sp. CAU 1744]